jgi:hypothetical protein
VKEKVGRAFGEGSGLVKAGVIVRHCLREIVMISCNRVELKQKTSASAISTLQPCGTLTGGFTSFVKCD